MIENKKQLAVTKSWIKKFEQDAKTLAGTQVDNVHPKLLKASVDAMKSQVAALKKEVENYEKAQAN